MTLYITHKIITKHQPGIVVINIKSNLNGIFAVDTQWFNLQGKCVTGRECHKGYAYDIKLKI